LKEARAGKVPKTAPNRSREQCLHEWVCHTPIYGLWARSRRRLYARTRASPRPPRL